ncbi:proton channel OTOP2 [Bombina bombina]|uniref:proton channel OTOP2 n=1 Tax=Bombina bombina TaxID=8345 RepID=UPI00235AC29C|nr:proton channel OTOP2 [Bombina bombina]
MHIKESKILGVRTRTLGDLASGICQALHKLQHVSMSPDTKDETPTAISTISTAPTYTHDKISLGQSSLISDGPPEVWKKGGRLLSALLALNVLLLACALVSSGAFSDVNVAEREVLSFLSVLMGLSGCWMVLYLLWTYRHPDLKDSHAGPIWLRVGLALFGVCTLVLDVLKIGKTVNLGSCASPLSIVHPVIQCVFVVIQTYFLWVSCQNCVQIHINLTRCGLMLTLSTNLAIWMAAVTEESNHQTHLLNEDHISNKSQQARAGGSDGCKCTTDLCKIMETGYYYLYPFNIEYSLFATTMAYVMWKNVGRIINQHSHHTHHTFKVRSLFVGIVFGIGVLLAGLGVFIVYEVEMNAKTGFPKALNMFYIFNIVALSLMSLCSIAGSIIYRFDKRDMDNHKNPTRTLDVGLLVGAALGQYFISFYSIVAVVAKTPSDLHNALNLVYSLLMLVQHTVQNIFIIEGLHRQPLHDGPSMRHEKDLYNNVFINHDAATSHINHSGTDQVMEIDSNHQGIPAHIISSDSGANWKRSSLREISQFLLFSNIIFWIMPAFGARPEFDNPLGVNFYGPTIWTAIVNIGLPFGIFYRMHAVASLVEVYLMS